MDQSLAKNFDFDYIEEFAGYNSTRDKTKIAKNFLVRGSQNVYRKISGNMAVRPGQKRWGAIDTALSPVSSEFVWNTSWGATYTIIVANSKVQVKYNGTFYDLIAFTAQTRYVFDKWWDNTEKKDRLLMVRGTAAIRHWSGGIAVIASSTANTITKVGAESWQSVGFSTTVGEKSITINGTVYTYTGGESTNTLTGVSGNPTGEAIGSIVIQTVIIESNVPASGFNNDFIKVINNQVYVGSYTSRLCYISKNTDFTDYTVPTPRAPGDPELLTMDSALNGISVRSGNAFISYGTNEWAAITFNNITVGTTLTQQTVVTVAPVAENAAAYAHEFIANDGNNIVYLSQDQQLRTVGDFNQSFVSAYPSLSLDVNAELADEDFTGGAVKCIGEFTYITAPVSGKVYLYQAREYVDKNGVKVNERLWHSPFVWNLTRVDDVDGIVYGFSNANPQIYQLWDTSQWHDDSPSQENLPYTCVMAMAYRNSGKRAKLQEYDKIYTEGYLTPGTPLNAQVNYEYQGAALQIAAVVNSVALPAYTFGTTVGSLGDSTLGEKILGDEIQNSNGDSNDLVKFRCINSVTLKNNFEYQIIYYSDTADAQWEIEAMGVNAVLADASPTYIINKVR